MSSLGQRIYRGEVSYNFLGRWRRWYTLSAILILISIGAVAIRGLNLGIEFRGGADFGLPSATCSVEEARTVAEVATGGPAIVTVAGSGAMRVQTEPLTPDESLIVAQELGAACGVAATDIRVQVVGPTWGAEITSKAIQGLLVFIALVTIFLAFYFEWRMAIAALVALIHDLIITIGIYALIGLEVTPATIIGILTILAYSLYDTVVVFDKVKENTRNIAGQSVMTYEEAANLAVNQTVVRSLNTSITSILPVLAIIIVGAGLLGAGTLLDLAVALAVGTAAGAYSSIFIATPVLSQMRSRQPEMKALAARVHARRKQAAAKGAQPESADQAPATLVSSRVESLERNQPKRSSRSRRKKG
jgi:preprotein translocase subunit SecF